MLPENLMWMGDKAFIYYTPAYCNYLMGCNSGEPAGLSCFAGPLEHKTGFASGSVAAIPIELDTCLAHCLKKFNHFDANPDIYGNLREELSDLQATIANLLVAP